MSFFAFLIICIVGLIIYYFYLIFKSEKITDFDSSSYNDYRPTEYYMEEPIRVTLEMVTPEHNDIVNVPIPNEDDKSVSTSSNSENKYNATTNTHKNELFDIAQYITADDIALGHSMFSGFNL